MAITNLAQTIEGVLFASGEPIALKDLCEKFEVTKSQMKEAVDEIELKYSKESGIILLKFGEKLQFATNPKYADQIAAVLQPIKEKALSKACLETMAIIAYKQPVTRLEIEDVRGTDSSYTCDILDKNGLIEVVGRKDTVGKPLLLGTTEEFLRRFRLESLDALPDYDRLMARLQTIECGGGEAEGETQQSLFNYFDVPHEEQLPEFLEGENIEVVGDGIVLAKDKYVETEDDGVVFEEIEN